MRLRLVQFSVVAAAATRFQFYNSAIKTANHAAYLAGQAAFQFYNSAIKTLRFMKALKPLIRFNSTIVRLRQIHDALASKRFPSFQFYNSAIKTETNILAAPAIIEFQFYNSAIKTFRYYATMERFS